MKHQLYEDAASKQHDLLNSGLQEAGISVNVKQANMEVKSDSCRNERCHNVSATVKY